jgi:SAM-dependent methyltransferase
MDEFVYDELAAAERTHWWFQGRRRILVDVLRRRLPTEDADRLVIDVGCGTGEMLDMVREFGRVTGLDASLKAVGYCRARFGDAVDIHLGRIPDDVPDGAALITAFDVVEHLEDDEKALTGICERLAPGGVFVCTVPAFPFLWSGHDDVHHHYRRYTRKILRRRLEDAGFVVERVTFFNTVLFPPAAVVRLLHRFLPGGAKGSDASLSSGPANRLLRAVFSAERFLLRLTDLPVGVSLLAVCHHPAALQRPS